MRAKSCLAAILLSVSIWSTCDGQIIGGVMTVTGAEMH